MSFTKLFPVFVFLCMICPAFIAAQAYEIDVKIDEYEHKEAYLGYYYGEKQYMKDTVQINDEGKFVFKGDEALDQGFYLIIMAPDNNYFQILVDDDQKFSVQTNAKTPNESMKIKGSKENELFYKYMDFLSQKRPIADVLRKEMEAVKDDKSKTAKLQKKLDVIDEDVQKRQDQILKDHPSSLTALLLKSQKEIPMPEFEGTEEEIKLARFQHYKKHYFDNVPLDDDRLLRSPILHKRVIYYVEKLTYQHPDSLAKSVSYMLDKMKPAKDKDNFKYYLIHFLNEYAKAKIVGMDAIYVHLVERYYESGDAPWTDEEQLKKIIKNAKTLKPILIGKTAPDIKMQLEDKTSISLYDVKSEYTVLFFWDPDCGHCKKSMPKVVEFYEKYKPKGVEIFAVCTKVTDKVPECWDFIKEKDMQRWINVVDPWIKSKYKTIYDVKSTPRIFILDKDKEILSKRIGAEQLGEVIDQFLEQKKREQEKEKEGKGSEK